MLRLVRRKNIKSENWIYKYFSVKISVKHTKAKPNEKSGMFFPKFFSTILKAISVWPKEQNT